MEVVIAVVVGVAVAGIVASGRLLWNRIFAKPRVGPDTEINYSELAGELLNQFAERAQLPGAPPVDTKQLAAQPATAETQRLLDEAIELQKDSKERAAIEKLLTAYDMDMPGEAKAQLHLLVGNGFVRLSDYGAAEYHYRTSLEAGRAAKSKAAEGGVLGNLGLVYRSQGDIAKAEDHHQRSLAIAREIGDRSSEANALGNLGNIYYAKGDLPRAEDRYQQALAIQRETSDRRGEALGLGNLGNVYGDQGEHVKAEEHYQQALQIDREIGYRLGEAQQLGNLGVVYRAQGDLTKANDHHRQALAIDREIGYRHGEANQLGNLGLLAADRDEKDEACELLKEAATIYEEIGAGGEGPVTVRAALEELGCA